MKLNNNDYIDSRQFTKEECEKFCELAVPQGYELGKVMLYYGKSSLPFLAIHWNKPYWSAEPRSYWNDVTEQFRKYLIAQESTSPKSLLKDGMRLVHKDGTIGWVCGDRVRFDDYGYNYLSRYTDGLDDRISGHYNIIKVIDRDDSVVWEREEQPEPKEMTVAEIEKALGHSIKVVK